MDRYGKEVLEVSIWKYDIKGSVSLRYICYLSFQLVTFLLKTLLEEKTVIVELGESQPRLLLLLVC